MSDCSDLECAEETPCLPLQIYVPTRGKAQTTHSNDTAQLITGFSLPADELMQNLLITLTGRSADGSVRVSYQIPVMVTNLQSESPNAYSADQGSQSDMNNEDAELEAEVVVNGDVGALLRVTDVSSDAGVMEWNWMIWVLDEIKLS